MKALNKPKIQCATVGKSKQLASGVSMYLNFSLCHLLFRLLLKLSEPQISAVFHVSFNTFESGLNSGLALTIESDRRDIVLSG